MATTVHIAIYEPIDNRDPNHWAIYLSNSDKGGVILQVGDDKTGVGYYVEEPIYNKQPDRSKRLETTLDVGTISSENHGLAIASIQATPVDNDSTTWNCQAWVIQALDDLETRGVFEWIKAGKDAALERRQEWQ